MVEDSPPREGGDIGYSGLMLLAAATGATDLLIVDGVQSASMVHLEEATSKEEFDQCSV